MRVTKCVILVKNKKEKKNTITLTKNNKRPIFGLYKKTTIDVNLAINL